MATPASEGETESSALTAARRASAGKARPGNAECARYDLRCAELPGPGWDGTGSGNRLDGAGVSGAPPHPERQLEAKG